MAMASPSDAALVRYLLGNADREDEERFDELSVTDAAFAERLRTIEHDLADAYVRDELSPSDRERWVARYLASPQGRNDLALAEALAAREAEHRRSPRRGRRAQIVAAGALKPAVWWATAAAAVLMIAVVGGYRVLHRDLPAETVAQHPSTIAPTPAPTTPTPVASVVALTLSPSVRSISEPPTLTIPHGTTAVKLTLRLDADESKSYTVALRNLTSNAVVWNSSDIAAEGQGANRSLVMSIPASTFQTARYLISASVGSSNAREIVATYPLVVVLE
jgi:hypothetical protein